MVANFELLDSRGETVIDNDSSAEAIRFRANTEDPRRHELSTSNPKTRQFGDSCLITCFRETTDHAAQSLDAQGHHQKSWRQRHRAGHRRKRVETDLPSGNRSTR